MDSFFTKLRQQVSFHQVNSDSEDDSGTPASSSQDIEVDEFLLVETTESPIIAACDASFLPQRYQEPPPTYRQVSEADELPSYQSVLDGSCTIVSEPTMFSEAKFSALKCHESCPPHNQRSALSDVPFRLNSTLEMQQHVISIFNDLSLDHNSFDWSKHSHDFEKERLCLRELSSDELADIDEFVIPHSDSQSCGLLPSHDSEINLMQF